MWSARLVLESEPRWLRHFYLYDKDEKQIERLQELRKAQPRRKPKEPARTIKVQHGDFNIEVHRLLMSGCIGLKEATFCLLDQRTFQCRWATVEALSQCARAKHKIELFYFLPNGWFNRAFSAVKDTHILQAWWGRQDWRKLGEMRAWDREEAFMERFRKDLEYKYVVSWPIFDRPKGKRRVMYFMIHATDHPVAPKLMERAYTKAVSPKEAQRDLFAALGIDQ